MYSYIWKKDAAINANDTANVNYNISGIAPLWWREHCLECAMPLCYKTCPLYSPRMDKRCLRFDNGIVPVNYDTHKGALISFRRWAKLESALPDMLNVLTVDEVCRIQKKYDLCESLVRNFCNCIKYYRPSQVIASITERINNKKYRHQVEGLAPDGFLAIIKNHCDEDKQLLLEIHEDGKSLFKTSMILKKGWNEEFIPLQKITITGQGNGRRFIKAYLNDNEVGLLEFFMFDFVKLKNKEVATPAQKVKCVAWDLDNTLWEGVIGDDGKDGVVPFKHSIKLIKELDDRGIIQTIASKNTPEVAWEKIEELGLADYFLYPAINWGRKSQSLSNIAKELNINIDTFAVIDDSLFERREISMNLPQVRVYDAIEVPILLSKPEFDVPITEASKSRRKSYLSEYKRKNISSSWEGDYDSFLKSCKIKMEIFTPKAEKEKERCLELILRSNQYNITGVKYETDEFMKMLTSKDYDCYGFRIKDDYGDYGIVGFASFEKRDSDLILHDFVMSCRVALKKIERAFFNHILSQESSLKFNLLKIHAVKTTRNTPLREQLALMPLKVVAEDEQSIDYEFSIGEKFVDDGIIMIV